MYKSKNDPAVDSVKDGSHSSSTPQSSSLYSGSSADVKSSTSNYSTSGQFEELNMSENMFQGNNSNSFGNSPIFQVGQSKANSTALDGSGKEISSPMFPSVHCSDSSTELVSSKDSAEMETSKKHQENSVRFNMELSQDFSQCQPDLENKSSETEDIEPQDLAKESTLEKKEEKEIFLPPAENTKKAKIQKLKKIMESMKISLKDLVDEEPGYSKMTELKCVNGRSNSDDHHEVEESQESEVFKGNQIFAPWGNFYYPSIVQSVDHDKKCLEVLFEDGEKTTVEFTKPLYEKKFPRYQKVLVKQKKTYKDGVIYHCERVAGEYKYLVLLQQKTSLLVGRSDLCFHKSHITKEPRFQVMQREKYPTRKRVREPPSSSSSNECEAKRRNAPDKLFNGCHFLITKAQAQQTSSNSDTENSETATEAEEHTEMNEKLCLQVIGEEGGVYIDKLTSRELTKTKRLVCLTDITGTTKTSSTIKFLYCVACGIPIVHFDWLHRCVEQRQLIPHSSYLVPAGKDVTGDDVEQDTGIREIYTPLKLIRIYVHAGEYKTLLREVYFLLQKIGCEIVASNHHVTKRSKGIPFDIQTVHYVLTLDSHVPDILKKACKDAGRALVTFEWLKQCIINNKLLDVDDIPRFTYK